MGSFFQIRLTAGVSMLLAIATATTSAAVAPNSLHQRKLKSATTAPQCSSASPLKNAGPNSFVGVLTGQNVAGGAISGGGITQYAGVVAGYQNAACSSYSGIVAGEDNQVGSIDTPFGTYSVDSMIGAGSGNTILNATQSFIASGSSNYISGNQLDGYDVSSSGSAIIAGAANSALATNGSFIGSGNSNSISGLTQGPGRNADNSVIGGGSSNLIGGNDDVIVGGVNNAEVPQEGIGFFGPKNDFIGGGYGNRITLTSAGGANGSGDAVIAGGANNLIASATTSAAYWGTIGGGSRNTVTGIGATIPGGVSNTAAGASSFAAGTSSYAKHDGSFVFSDDATGARQLVTSAPNQFQVRASGGFALYSNAGLTAGVVLRPGAGSWSSLSDRASKTAIVALNADAVLEKVAALPVSEWSYRSEASSIRHVGPMSQDFYAAFGIGEDPRHITTIDEDGVALAAIKGLYAKNVALTDQVRRLEARDAKLEATMHALVTRFEATR